MDVGGFAGQGERSISAYRTGHKSQGKNGDEVEA